jgi:hypothetical protein
LLKLRQGLQNSNLNEHITEPTNRELPTAMLFFNTKSERGMLFIRSLARTKYKKKRILKLTIICDVSQTVVDDALYEVDDVIDVFCDSRQSRWW